MSGVKIVGFICDEEGRHLEAAKVEKLCKWVKCESVMEVRAFIGVAVYYRIWIPEFAIKATPLFDLMKKGVEFVWGPKQEETMESIKDALIRAPALVTPQYGEDAGVLIVAVDASDTG